MQRRQFFAAPLSFVAAWCVAPASADAVAREHLRPSFAVPPDWGYGGPYVDMGCLDMHFYVKRDESAYAILTYHRYDDGQNYRGPYPAYEWELFEDIEWLRRCFPGAIKRAL